jgi:hypothetical protein
MTSPSDDVLLGTPMRRDDAMIIAIRIFVDEEIAMAKAQLQAEIAVLRVDLNTTRAELAAARAEAAIRRDSGSDRPARRIANALNPSASSRA